MDQPLTTVAAATNQAASNATHQISPFDRTSATLRSLGAARLLVLGATALGLFGLSAFLLLREAEPHLTLLYGELELEDGAAIVGRLETLGVTFRLQGDGRAILVPADQALRMTLAEEGLPRGGTVRDEIFDQQSALGTTDFLANVNLRRALEGELARTIASLADVRAARAPGPAPARAVPPPADRAERFADLAHVSWAAPRPPPGASHPAPGRCGGDRAVARAHRAGRPPGHPARAGRKIGESIDILVNDRLVARGQVVIVDDRLGVTMTEIIKTAP